MDDVKRQLQKFKQENHDLEAELLSASPYSRHAFVVTNSSI
jgi:hypothetical protein